MKFLLLVLLAACSVTPPHDRDLNKPGENVAAGENVPEPSLTNPNPEATPKSPYTVGNCACRKIYKPVCGSNGQNYGNSCEAECNKVSWTNGPCRKP